MKNLTLDNHDTVYVKQYKQKVSIKFTFFSAIGLSIFILFWLFYFFEKKFIIIEINTINDLVVFTALTGLLVYRFFEETKRYDYQTLYLYKILINIKKMCIL